MWLRRNPLVITTSQCLFAIQLIVTHSATIKRNTETITKLIQSSLWNVNKGTFPTATLCRRTWTDWQINRNVKIAEMLTNIGNAVCLWLEHKLCLTLNNIWVYIDITLDTIFAYWLQWNKLTISQSLSRTSLVLLLETQWNSNGTDINLDSTSALS